MSIKSLMERHWKAVSVASPLQSVANLSKRAGVMVRGRWLPESELRKMLENVARLNLEGVKQ